MRYRATSRQRMTPCRRGDGPGKILVEIEEDRAGHVSLRVRTASCRRIGEIEAAVDRHRLRLAERLLELLCDYQNAFVQLVHYEGRILPTRPLYTVVQSWTIAPPRERSPGPP